MEQITSTILMVRPASFRANEQTAVNNYFQKSFDDVDQDQLEADAQIEFDDFVDKLRANDIEVIVYDPSDGLDTPDAHFPNNWVSFHANGVVALYPMFAENRRLERREDVILELENQGYIIEHIVDYTSAEEENLFLEGTGSLILDRTNRKAYCALSQRADEELFIEFCEDFDYFPVVFRANQTVDGRREPIYHTNVMMCIGESFAVICLDCIDDKKERKNVKKHLLDDGKEIIAISEKQVAQFAGNMLQVKSKKGDRILVMSQSARDSLNDEQLAAIEKYSKILTSDLRVIEACGGGSARCMMAEVFLPKKAE
ncbi:MAG: amidinotransferase [Flavobacteriaceae bacterium]|nr:amidinotransferase [Flavobacteriaceae bacterium]